MANPDSSFSMRGAIDLSALAAARKAEAESAQARATAPAGAIVDVNELNFEVEVLARSQQVPVVVQFWSPRSQLCLQLVPVLEKLTAQHAGKVVLAKVNVDVEQRLAVEFQLQSVPAVFMVVGGQARGLFQEVPSDDQLRQLFEQIVKVGEQLAGAEEGDAPAEEPVDPRYERAFEAIEQRDWPAARAAYQEVLSANPADEDAKAGLAQVELLARTDGLDVTAIAASAPTTTDELLVVADCLILTGRPDVAFEKLLDGFAKAEGAEQDSVRNRLLELFLVVGDSDVVRVARRNLTNLLY